MTGCATIKDACASKQEADIKEIEANIFHKGAPDIQSVVIVIMFFRIVMVWRSALWRAWCSSNLVSFLCLIILLELFVFVDLFSCSFWYSTDNMFHFILTSESISWVSSLDRQTLLPWILSPGFVSPVRTTKISYSKHRKLFKATIQTSIYSTITA